MRWVKFVEWRRAGRLRQSKRNFANSIWGSHSPATAASASHAQCPGFDEHCLLDHACKPSTQELEARDAELRVILEHMTIWDFGSNKNQQTNKTHLYTWTNCSQTLLSPGATHYFPLNTTQRVLNTGQNPLTLSHLNTFKSRGDQDDYSLSSKFPSTPLP